MKAQLGQYMNEVVSLSILLLMTIALIAGQAGASVHGLVNADGESAVESMRQASTSKGSKLIQIDAGMLSLHIDVLLDDIADSVFVDEITDGLRDVIDVEFSTAP